MKCPDCEDGWVEREIYHKQSFNLDVGYIEVIRSRECETCGGTGEIEDGDDILQEIDDQNYVYAKKLHDAIFNQVGQEAMKLRASNAVRDAINENGMEKVKSYKMRDFSSVKNLGKKAIKLILTAQNKINEATMITHETNAAYHAHSAIGSTSVKKVLSSTVAHWRHDEFKPSPAMQIGSAVHALYLEHEKPLVIKGPETRRGNLWKNLEQNLEPDQVLLTKADYDKAVAMRDALYDNRDMQQLWQQDGWTREASMYVDCEESGLKLKVKSDAFNKRLKTMIDVKTCVSAAPRDWVSQYGPFQKFLYNVQACYYMHVANLCGVEINKFCIFAVENTPHHATAAYTISKQTIDAARPLMFAALAQIKEAQDSGHYKTGWDGWTIL